MLDQGWRDNLTVKPTTEPYFTLDYRPLICIFTYCQTQTTYPAAFAEIPGSRLAEREAQSGVYTNCVMRDDQSSISSNVPDRNDINSQIRKLVCTGTTTLGSFENVLLEISNIPLLFVSSLTVE